MRGRAARLLSCTAVLLRCASELFTGPPHVVPNAAITLRNSSNGKHNRWLPAWGPHSMPCLRCLLRCCHVFAAAGVDPDRLHWRPPAPHGAFDEAQLCTASADLRSLPALLAMTQTNITLPANARFFLCLPAGERSIGASSSFCSSSVFSGLDFLQRLTSCVH